MNDKIFMVGVFIDVMYFSIRVIWFMILVRFGF